MRPYKISIEQNKWFEFQKYLTSIRYGFSSKIARRFVFYTLLFSTSFAVIITSIQLFIDFKAEQFDLSSSIRKVEEAIVPSLTESVWALDDQLINSQLSGIVHVDGVIYAKLIDSDGLSIEVGVNSTDVFETHKLNLIKNSGEKLENIGELTIGVSYRDIYNGLINRAIVELIASLFKTFMLTAVILIIYQIIIGRHIYDLAKFAHQYSHGKTDQYFLLNRKLSAVDSYGDELSQLEISINNWIRTNEDHINQLKDVNQELSTFTYSLSHDLKSPVNTLQMSLMTTMGEIDKHLDDDTRYLMNLALRTNERMRTIIDDTLEYARAGEETDLKNEIDLEEFIIEILDDLRGEIVAADADIKLGDLPTVIGNRILLRILLQNLLSNAVKFRSPDRKPIITVTSEDRANSGFCLIKVADNGIGIEPKYHHTTFKQFERLHTYKEFPGTGLGLSICKKIATKLGGKIRIISQVGEGTTFEIDLMKAGKGHFK